MNLQHEVTKISDAISTLEAKRFAAEKEHARWANSILLADMGPGERAKAPEERGRLVQRIAEIDRELAKAEGDRKKLNEAHLSRRWDKSPAKPTADLKQTAKVLEDLEQRRLTVQTMIHSLETDRAKVILAAQTGNPKARADADRMSNELVGLTRDAADIELALIQAREQLKAAQANADKGAADDRAAQAAKFSAQAVELAAECDQHLRAAAAIFDNCASLHRQVVKLGQLSDINSRRLANPRVAESALIAAGLKPFVPSLGGGISIKPSTLADSYKALFPFAGRNAGKAA